jgi:D-methionine transport system substrate-binding protein
MEEFRPNSGPRPRHRPNETPLLILAFILITLMSLASCGRATQHGPGQDKTIRLITSDLWIIPQIVGVLKGEVAKQGYVLDWVVVNDIIQPNKLVDDGTADANMFQHEPYFDQFVLDHGLEHVTRGFYTYFVPSGLFSKKYKSLAQLPDGATFGIPVDPANNGRALFMLRDKGLLTLRDGVQVTHASQKDITENPHHYKFKEVDQLMQQRTLEDVDAGFLFLNYAIMIGFNPTRDALALEDPHTPTYRGIVAVRKDLVGAPKIKALQNAFASEELKQLLRNQYGDAIVFLDYLNK